MKKALLVVSFGTTHMDTLEKNIAAVERELASAFPDRTVFRAFTSSIVRKRLAERGIAVDDVLTAMGKIRDAGYEDVLIQSTHVICGMEWEKILAQMEPFAFPVCKIGLPLLSRDADYPAMAKAVLSDLPGKQADTAILLMGHGTEHATDTSYDVLQKTFFEMERDDVYLATVEGAVRLEDIHLPAQVKKVICAPLMLVAGDHAQNDMSSEEEDSWKSQLQRAGFSVSCILEGLGEKKAIRQMYVDHAKRADPVQTC